MQTELRRYGQWAGNPRGMVENPAKCVKTVWGSSAWNRGQQCSRKRGHGPDGLYCKQHAKRFDGDGSWPY